MDTERTLYEIEVALAKTDTFNFVKNIVAYNVNGVGASLLLCHECDMLVLSKSGYLTEIEIKRSWTDFLADFKKKHKHESNGLVKYFYYCVPECMLDKVYEKLEELEVDYSGVITYDENLKIKFHGYRVRNDKYHINTDEEYSYFNREQPHRKLFLEEQLQVARYGAMRAIGLKEKLINLSISAHITE